MLNIFSLDQINPSAEDWLGIYLRKDMMYNNNQVFKKDGKEQFLFTNDRLETSQWEARVTFSGGARWFSAHPRGSLEFLEWRRLADWTDFDC